MQKKEKEANDYAYCASFADRGKPPSQQNAAPARLQQNAAPARPQPDSASTSNQQNAVPTSNQQNTAPTGSHEAETPPEAAPTHNGTALPP